jgi:hypothetical protein
MKMGAWDRKPIRRYGQAKNENIERSQVERGVRPWSIDDFKADKVRIDFRDWTMPELNRLRKILKIIRPDFEEPVYRFGPCYYCDNGRWYEGGHHQLKGELCRATEIKA